MASAARAALEVRGDRVAQVASAALAVLEVRGDRAAWVASAALAVLEVWVDRAAQVASVATVPRLCRLAVMVLATGRTTRHIVAVHLIRIARRQTGLEAMLAVIRWRNDRPVRGNKLLARVEI